MQIVVLAFPLISLLIFLTLVQYFTLHPVKPINFLGFRIQGAIPAKRNAISKAIAEKAASEFAGISGLESHLVNPKNFDRLKPVIENHMDDFLRNRLKDQMPMISMFIGDKTIQSLKTIFIAEIEKLFPMVIGQFAGNLQKELPVGPMIQQKLDSISDEELNRQLAATLTRTFSPLYKLAILLGLLMGLILWLLQTQFA